MHTSASGGSSQTPQTQSKCDHPVAGLFFEKKIGNSTFKKNTIGEKGTDLRMSLPSNIATVPVNYVATHEIDDKPVCDHKTGERLSPFLVKIGRRTECEATVRHQVFERVLIPLARGKKVRCQWLDEMKQGPDGPFVCSRLVAMKRITAFASIRSQAQHLSNVPRASFRGPHTLAYSDSMTTALRSGMRCHFTTSQLRCIRRVEKRRQATCGK